MNPVSIDMVQYIPHLRRYARALAHNSMAADDLVQECLTRALTKSHLFRPDTNLRAWLFTILHNLHASELRRVRRAGIVVEPDKTTIGMAVSPDHDVHLVVKDLQNALRLLPTKQRDLVLQIGLEGISYAEAAERFNVPIGTIKSRLSRSRQMLRDALEGQERANI